MSHHQSENRIVLLTLPVMQKYTEISKFFHFSRQNFKFCCLVIPISIQYSTRARGYDGSTCATSVVMNILCFFLFRYSLKSLYQAAKSGNAEKLVQVLGKA